MEAFVDMIRRSSELVGLIESVTASGQVSEN